VQLAVVITAWRHDDVTPRAAAATAAADQRVTVTDTRRVTGDCTLCHGLVITASRIVITQQRQWEIYKDFWIWYDIILKRLARNIRRWTHLSYLRAKLDAIRYRIADVIFQQRVYWMTKLEFVPL